MQIVSTNFEKLQGVEEPATIPPYSIKLPGMRASYHADALTEALLNRPWNRKASAAVDAAIALREGGEA